MTTTLDTGALRIATKWSKRRSATAGQQSRQTGPYGKATSPTIGASNCNAQYAVSGTLAAGASVTIDLSSVTDDLGTALSPVRGYTVQLYVTGTTWKYEPGAANPLSWFLSGTTPAVSGGSGAQFAFGDTTAQTIDGTHKTIKLTNTNGGSTSLTYTLIFLLGT